MNNQNYNNNNFNLKVLSELSCKVEGNGQFFAKKGSMVADQGAFKYEKVLLDPNNTGAVGSVVNYGIKKLTGEHMEIMKATGQGTVYLADLAQHVTVLDLAQGESVAVESENLLAFTADVKYGVEMIGTGVISQKGLFTSKLTGLSDYSQVAVTTNGNPIVLQTPCRVDPDAVVCWTGPNPGVKLDVNWKTLIGQTSGESYMLEFKQPGHIVVIQPYERESGISLRDKTRPTTQKNPLNGLKDSFGPNGANNPMGGFNGQNNPLGGSSQNNPLGGLGQGNQGGVGGVLNSLNNILGGGR